MNSTLISQTISSYLDKISGNADISEIEHRTIFLHMLSGYISDVQLAAILMAWKCRGESEDVLWAGAEALRTTAVSLEVSPKIRPLTDNCGTGGDGSFSFNLSTTAAIVAAAAGVTMAKHGNRSVSGRCGSADLLFRAGYPENISHEKAVQLLAQTGLTFFFAPNFHPAMRYVGPVRKALGIRTIFNLLGPLANPIAPEYQLMGVGHKNYLKPMAATLNRLGIVRGLVVHSQDGLDEVSPAALTQGILVENGVLSPLSIDPKDYGIKGHISDLMGGDVEQNYSILQEILGGSRNGPFEGVCLNAGATIWIANKTATLQEGVLLARDILGSGTAKVYFDTWLKKAHELANPIL